MKILPRPLFDLLEERYGPLWPWEEKEEAPRDPFETLVVTVLSQNTSNRNTEMAHRGLKARFQITAQAILSAKEEDIRDAIRSGGLYNVKAKRLKQLARVVMDKYRGDLKPVLDLPREEARKKLLELPGVGEKTADVMLTTRHTYREVIPIDTHLDRVAKRLGLAGQGASYEEVQEALIEFLPSEVRGRGAGLLWLLAKHTCRAPRPKCEECPIIGICPSGGGKSRT